MECFIVIVTYNGIKWIERCLNSCANYPVIVVDNASTDNTIDFIKENFPKVNVLQQTNNLGFGGGNNLGISYALNLGAQHVFLLNQDAYLIEDCLEKMISIMKQNDSYGILSPIHINNNRTKLDFGFYSYMQSNHQFYFDFVLENKKATIYDVPFMNAAAWLISRECLLKVGGFDPIFYHYGEDDNYCQRVIYNGFNIGVVSNSFVIHDRENRVKKRITPFSLENLKKSERYFKKDFANVLDDKAFLKHESQVKKTLKKILKQLIQCNFKKAKYFFLEYKLLKRIKSEISQSYFTNKTTGSHYLSINK
jgi:GT2 family glycosyltransferase